MPPPKPVKPNLRNVRASTRHPAEVWLGVISFAIRSRSFLRLDMTSSFNRPLGKFRGIFLRPGRPRELQFSSVLYPTAGCGVFCGVDVFGTRMIYGGAVNLRAMPPNHT